MLGLHLALMSFSTLAEPARSPPVKAPLEFRVLSEVASPEIEAREAARRGDFAMVVVARRFRTSPEGVTCFTPGGMPPATKATIFQGGDYFVLDAQGRMPQDRELRYGARFNRALVERPEFPYRDLCGPEGTSLVAANRWLPPMRMAAREVRGPPMNLHEAARRGSEADVRRHLVRASPNEPDAFGMTPLAWAVSRGRVRNAHMLLAAGADPKITQEFDPLSPLSLAVALGHAELIDPLLAASRSAQIPPWPRWYAHRAMHSGDPATLRRILSEPHAPIDHWFSRYDVPSHPVMKVLLDAKEPGTARALLAASSETGDLAGVRLALASGADPNVGDRESTPLSTAVRGYRSADVEIVTALIDAGADVNRRGDPSRQFHTPLQGAVYNFGGVDAQSQARRRAIIDHLLRAEADVNARGPKGEPMIINLLFGAGAHTLDGLNNRLPADLLARLLDHGLAKDTLWLERTPLDHVEAVAPTSEVATLLQSRGAKRRTEAQRAAHPKSGPSERPL